MRRQADIETRGLADALGQTAGMVRVQSASRVVDDDARGVELRHPLHQVDKVLSVIVLDRVVDQADRQPFARFANRISGVGQVGKVI